MDQKNKRPGYHRGVIVFRRKQRLEQHNPPSSKTEAIHSLVDLGWSIFPIVPQSKIPLAKWVSGIAFEDRDFEQRFDNLLAAKSKKLKDKGMTLRNRSPLMHLDLFRASKDKVVIDRWLTQWPKAGFAVACEPSGLFVLDVDRHGDIDGTNTLSLLQQRFGKLPISPLQRTGGGGFQIFFAMPAGLVLGNSCSKLGAGLDTRGKGGMAILPPSIHRSGKAYRWITGRTPWKVPLVAPPVWLSEFLERRTEPELRRPFLGFISEASRTRYAGEALTAELRILQQAKLGERNQILNRVSFSLGQLAAAGLLEEQATLDLVAAAAKEIGLQMEEIERTIRSGWTHGLLHPREIRA